MSPKGKTCSKCHAQPNDKKKSVSCDSCKGLICAECHGLSPTEIRAFELKTRVVTFLCESCKSTMAQLPSIMKKLDELDKEVQQLRLRQNMLATESAIQELAERGKRANNLIIYDIPESSSDQPLQRQEHDTEECKTIIASLTKKVNCEDIKVIRLGRQNSKNGNLPRPVKVIMKSKTDAIEVLRNKSKLTKPTKIQPDQTVMQREYLKYLRDELERRTSNGETDLTIKYIYGQPKIVNQTDKKN